MPAQGQEDLRRRPAEPGELGRKTNAEMSLLSPEEPTPGDRGQPRPYLAAELLYAWTVEPKKWEDVPFL